MLKGRIAGWCRPLALWCGVLLLIGLTAHAQRTLYSTGFEYEEDYLPDLTLTGQNGWVGYGADGIVTNFFVGLGQQGYIGYAPASGETNDFYSVFYPINFTPAGTNQLVKFSVVMQIVDSSSTNGPWDDFRWSVYNTNGNRLFSLDFDNASLLVSYVLDDGKGFIPANSKFDTQGAYDLTIEMNFARNLWSATLNDVVIVNAKPITTINSPLNLGDIDAVWAVRDPVHPGDNFMLFDNYRVTVEASPSIQPRLEALGVAPAGPFQLRFYGEPGLVYRIESSSDFVRWDPMLTFTAPPGGTLEFQDSTATRSAPKFYRARQGQAP